MDVRRRFLCSSQYKESNSPEVNGYYTVDLNDNWQLSTRVSNPDSSLYDGVYESFSNYNVNSGTATMTITLNNLDSFTLYIRSYAETYYDYIMVSQLDVEINGNTSYQYSAAVKAHTRTNQNSGTDFYSYTPVTYENIGGGEHTITIVYRKDSSGNSYDDRGYVLIDKNVTVFEEGGNDSGGSNNPENTFNIDNYMTIEALESGLSVMNNYSSFEYCVDGDNNWKSLTANTYTPTINTGQTISFRGSGLTPVANTGIGTFTITKRCKLKGNCNSLLFGDNAATNYSLAEYQYAFYKLFYNCSNIQSISETFLPAMALSSYCYGYMFYGCTGLQNGVKLPATTLVSNCYYYMYHSCTSLTNAGSISATTLATYCCYGMFYKCTSLQSAPDLLANTLVSYCYYYMFSGCSSLNYVKTYAISLTGYYPMYYWLNGVAATGTFYKHPDATWTNTGLSGGVPDGWTLNYISSGTHSGGWND